jgi:Spy/CpxP family protein refolding chaperone
MTRHIKTLAVIFSVALNLAFLVGYGIRWYGERTRFAYEDLDLSQDQRVRIEAGRDRFLNALNDTGDRIIAKHLELMDLIAADPTKHLELMDLIAADPIDQQAIDAKFQEIHTTQHSMQNLVIAHLLEDKQILTAEQRTKFFALLKSRIQAQGAPGPPWLPAGGRERKK